MNNRDRNIEDSDRIASAAMLLLVLCVILACIFAPEVRREFVPVPAKAGGR